jgi:metal-responsive CopG/Arc/MetJ family transcriptional regulator
MEIVTMKMEKDMISRMDELITKHQYGTRTEFMRSAIRDKMSELEKEELIKKVLELKGTSKSKTSNADIRQIRELVGDEYLKEKGLK